MTQWRIRVIVPDGPDGRQALSNALARVPATQLLTAPDFSDTAEPSGDVVVELGDEAALADLLRTLHEVSPRVFISKVPGEAGEPGLSLAR